MKKASVKSSPKREANKFAGLKTQKKGPEKAPPTPKKAQKTEWWRKPVEENSDQVKSS
jgi:hypothetical protein